jgi:tetratricopeptide (TPR) repeat protein
VSDEETLAADLLAGAKALREGDAATAVRLLSRAVVHEGLAADASLALIRARSLSLYGQALLENGNAKDAEDPVLDAMRILRALEDTEGLHQVRDLHRQVRETLESAAKEQARLRAMAALAAQPMEQVRAKARTPFALAEILIQRANADIEAGQDDAALEVATEALSIATSLSSVRLEVLARLSIARIRPERALEELEAARQRADAANEFTLVGAVARAAEAHGLTIGVLAGPRPGKSLK